MATYTIESFAGGANLRDPPHKLGPTDVYFLSGYKCYEKSIKALGIDAIGNTLGEGVKKLFPSSNASFEDTLIAVTDVNVYSLDSTFAKTTITGAVTVTSGLMSGVHFNSYLILCNGVDQVIKVSSAPACTAAGFVGPGGVDTTLEQVWASQNRLYFVEKDTYTYWYGGRDKISGALKAVPLDGVFTKKGKLLFGASWSTNQGQNVEDLTIFVSNNGEVLIYTGDYPDSNTWRLLSRIKIPKPIGRFSFAQVGGDIAIYTKNGPLMLSEAVANASSPSAVYKISDKISGTFNRFAIPTVSQAEMIVDTEEPFLYMRAGRDPRISSGSVLDTQGSIWCQNLLTGAWSYIVINPPGEEGPYPSPATFTYVFNTLVFGFSGGEITYLTNNYVALGDYYGTLGGKYRKVETAWLNFGTDLKKQINTIRFYATNNARYDVSDAEYKATTRFRLSVLSKLRNSSNASDAYTITKIVDLKNNYTDTPTSNTNVICVTVNEIMSIGSHFKIILTAHGEYSSTQQQNQTEEIFNVEIDYE